jgi:hypothetical protein
MLLVVLSHGMWGNPSHMSEIEKSILFHYGDEVVIHNCSSNKFLYTYQGIAKCGHSMYKEIVDFVSFHNKTYSERKVTAISFIGYSAGGLFSRYCVALMYKHNFFQSIKPSHFITIATPHLGTRMSNNRFVGRVFNLAYDSLIKVVAGQTGQELSLTDISSTHNTPILVQMSILDSLYMKALLSFSHVYFYANVSNDNTVPYCTSSISRRNHFKNIKYESIPKMVEGHVYVLSCEVLNSSKSNEKEVSVEVHSNGGGCSYIWTMVKMSLLLCILPLLLVHFCLVIIPMRIASMCCVHSFNEETDDAMVEYCPLQNKTVTVEGPASNLSDISLVEDTDTNNKYNKLEQPIGQANVNFCYDAIGDSHISLNDLSGSGDTADKSNTNTNVDDDGEKREKREKIERGGDLDPGVCERNAGGGYALPVHEYPWVILDNLHQAPIHRVNVYIEGAHTHGKVICRSLTNEAGLEVIAHITKKVIALK